jgi:hypothetical protein
MIKVKIRTSNNVKLSIPVPYSILKAGSFILGSKRVHQQLHKWANQDLEQKNIPILPFNLLLNKQLLNEVIKELSDYKGTVLVDAKLQDGTEVIVRL